MGTPIDARIKKLAKGLSAKKVADAFLRAVDDPTTVSESERSLADEFEATVEAMFLMAAVDGDLAADELAQLAGSVDAFAALDDEPAPKKIDTSKLLAVFNERLANEGWNKRLASVATRLPSKEARAFAYRLAAGVAFVDDHVAHAEAAALEAFASAFALGADETQEILYDVRDALFD